jgi:hypothetical protein
MDSRFRGNDKERFAVVIKSINYSIHQNFMLEVFLIGVHLRRLEAPTFGYPRPN